MEKNHIFCFIVFVALFFFSLEIPVISSEENQNIIISKSEVVQYHEPVHTEPSHVSVSLQQTAAISNSYVSKLGEFADEHLEIQGYEDTGQCRPRRNHKEFMKKRLLIGAENGMVLTTTYKLLEYGNSIRTEEDKFSDFISIDEIIQEKEEIKTKSSHVVMFDPYFTQEIYINEDQVIEIWSQNISTQTRKLYHKLFGRYPDGTPFSRESTLSKWTRGGGSITSGL